MTNEQVVRLQALRYAFEEGFRSGCKDTMGLSCPRFYLHDEDCQHAAETGYNLAQKDRADRAQS